MLQLTQQLQQEREALENAAEATRASRFEQLKASQLQRKDEVQALRDEYEVSLAGMEAQVSVRALLHARPSPPFVMKGGAFASHILSMAVVDCI
jgi:hypothetical protein